MTAGRSAQQVAARKRAKAVQLREQADTLERDADRWELGDAGERIVGGRLELLRAEGWYVVHDVRWPGRARANLDHVVVGPPGVLVVDSKNWSGSVTLEGGRLRQNGHPRDREARAAADAAAAVAARLGTGVVVLPVICLASGPTFAAKKAEHTTVLGVTELVDWARALPVRLDTDGVLRVAAQVRQELPPAGASHNPMTRAVAARGSRPGVPRRRATSAAGRRRTGGSRSGGRRLLVRLALGLAALMVLPWSLGQLAGALTASAQGAAPAPSASVPTVAAPVVFPGCKGLRATYPNGVKAAGAANAGRPARPVSAVDTSLATVNGRLDDDGDGLVCERPRTKQRSAKH